MPRAAPDIDGCEHFFIARARSVAGVVAGPVEGVAERVVPGDGAAPSMALAVVGGLGVLLVLSGEVALAIGIQPLDGGGLPNLAGDEDGETAKPLVVRAVPGSGSPAQRWRLILAAAASSVRLGWSGKVMRRRWRAGRGA